MEKEITKESLHVEVSASVQRFIEKEGIRELIQSILVRKNGLLSCVLHSAHTKNEINMMAMRVSAFFDILLEESISKYWQQNIILHKSHQERLTMLGQISTSFIHEFRNPLTTVMGFVKLLQDSEKEIPYLDIISGELQRLNENLSQFLNISKKDIFSEEENFFLQSLLEDIINLLYPKLLFAKTKVIKDVDMSYMISGVQGEIRQVLLNILINSIDALQLMEKEERMIVITAHEKTDYIELTIKNNGPAIPEDKVKAIFEPFFTTKEHGTGIGLFVCKQIMKKHGGDIICQSSEDWTSFFIQMRK